MADIMDILDEEIEHMRRAVHTAILARIDRYDHELMQADITPLIAEEVGPLAPIVNASVACLRAGGFIVRPPYAVGDLVVAVIIERGMDEVVETGGLADQVAVRKHSLTDAVVIGGFTAHPNPLPAAHGNDLVIAREGLTTKVIITPGGDIEAEGTGRIRLATDENIVLLDEHGTSITSTSDISLDAATDLTIEAGGSITIDAGTTLTITCNSGSMAAAGGFTITRQDGTEAVVWE